MFPVRLKAPMKCCLKLVILKQFLTYQLIHLSSLSKCINVISYVFRFVNNLNNSIANVDVNEYIKINENGALFLHPVT